MKVLIKFFVLLLISLSFCLTSCNKEEENDCTIKAYYRGTNVCTSEEAAAAVELESDGGYLTLHNFFDMIDSSSVVYDDLLYIEYGEVDSTLFLSGILCGVAIVAPEAELTCIVKAD